MLTMALLLAILFSFVAANSVTDRLPSCWNTCAASISDCTLSDTKCVCSLSNKTPYLTSVMACAKKSCDSFSTDDVHLFTTHIRSSCKLTSMPIEQFPLAAAQAAGSEKSANYSTGTSPRPLRRQLTGVDPAQPKVSTTFSRSITTTVGPSSGAIARATPNVEALSASSSLPTVDKTITDAGIVMASVAPTLPDYAIGTVPAVTRPLTSSTSVAGGGGTLFDSQGAAGSLQPLSKGCCAMLALALSFGLVIVL